MAQTYGKEFKRSWFTSLPVGRVAEYQKALVAFVYPADNPKQPIALLLAT